MEQIWGGCGGRGKGSDIPLHKWKFLQLAGLLHWILSTLFFSTAKPFAHAVYLFHTFVAHLRTTGYWSVAWCVPTEQELAASIQTEWDQPTGITVTLLPEVPFWAQYNCRIQWFGPVKALHCVNPLYHIFYLYLHHCSCNKNSLCNTTNTPASCTNVTRNLTWSGFIQKNENSSETIVVVWLKGEKQEIRDAIEWVYLTRRFLFYFKKNRSLIFSNQKDVAHKWMN